MVVDKLIEGVEFDHPQEILARTISKHLEVLDTTSKSGREGDSQNHLFNGYIAREGK